MSADPIDTLVARYGALIRRVVARVAGAKLAGGEDDVQQTVVMNLWRHVSREQTIDHPASYIYRIAVRETVRAVTRELARNQVSLDSEPDLPETLAASTPEREMDRVAMRGAITRAVAALAPDRARAVRAHLAGYEIAEIMGTYGWSYQRARNLVARGMADLRTALRREGFHD